MNKNNIFSLAFGFVFLVVLLGIVTTLFDKVMVLAFIVLHWRVIKQSYYVYGYFLFAVALLFICVTLINFETEGLALAYYIDRSGTWAFYYFLAGVASKVYYSI